MRGCNRPHLLWFSRYLTFEFWSRDRVVTWLFPEFFVSSSKCPVYQPFIWGAAIIGRTFFGSLVIWLLNFGHVTTWSRDFFRNFFVSSNKCPINQPFICGAKICCSYFGSLVIWLFNFDHVTTWSRDFFLFFLIRPINAQSTNLSYAVLKYAVAALVL